ncbi:MAG TPA: XRE family transcriptional regulator, partial [Aquificaceae bacterium]|nr:XRE family transcriptional regulator [Aquificaceae bacterium]
MSAVGERIRKLREERGLSPEEFAKAVGLTTSRLE